MTASAAGRPVQYHAWLDLDTDDEDLVGETARRWLREAGERLFPELLRLADARGSGVKGGIATWQPDSPLTSYRYSRSRFDEVIEAMSSRSWDVGVHVEVPQYQAAGLPSFNCGFRTVRGRFAALTASGASLPGQAARWADPTLWPSFLLDLAANTNPCYGTIIPGGEWQNRTALDRVLRRPESVPEARRYLRGYSWVTLCPEDLVVQYGGPDAFRRTEAFARVHAVEGGGLLLQATQAAEEYDDEAMLRIFRALAPILPPGQPRAVIEEDALGVVMMDAAHPD